MRRAAGSVIPGVVLAGLGALALIEAARIRDAWPGARLMPAAVGVALALLGVAHVVSPAAGGGEWPGAAGWRRVGLVFGGLALYVAALPSLGFVPATALFVMLVVRALGRYTWAVTLALTAAIAGASWIVFKHWLGMPLPAGVFGA